MKLLEHSKTLFEIITLASEIESYSKVYYNSVRDEHPNVTSSSLRIGTLIRTEDEKEVFKYTCNYRSDSTISACTGTRYSRLLSFTEPKILTVPWISHLDAMVYYSKYTGNVINIHDVPHEALDHRTCKQILDLDSIDELEFQLSTVMGCSDKQLVLYGLLSLLIDSPVQYNVNCRACVLNLENDYSFMIPELQKLLPLFKGTK